jgi:hypothetical protein
MKHPSSRELFAYWDERRGARLAPDRGEIEPGAIRRALGDTFILGATPSGDLAFRLAGTRVCALFGRELRERPFWSLWAPHQLAPVRAAAESVLADTRGLVAAVTGRTEDGTQIELEFLLLPLRHRGSHRLRLIGTIAPLSVPFWIGSYPLGDLVLGSWRQLATQPAPRFVAAPSPRLTVHQGGRR